MSPFPQVLIQKQLLEVVQVPQVLRVNTYVSKDSVITNHLLENNMALTSRCDIGTRARSLQGFILWLEHNPLDVKSF